MSEDDFVALITSGQPSAPAYFAVDAVLNRRRRDSVTEPHRSTALTPDAVRAAIESGVRVLDARTPKSSPPGTCAGRSTSVPTAGSPRRRA